MVCITTRISSLGSTVVVEDKEPHLIMKWEQRVSLAEIVQPLQEACKQRMDPANLLQGFGQLGRSEAQGLHKPAGRDPSAHTVLSGKGPGIPFTEADPLVGAAAPQPLRQKDLAREPAIPGNAAKAENTTKVEHLEPPPGLARAPPLPPLPPSPRDLKVMVMETLPSRHYRRDLCRVLWQQLLMEADGIEEQELLQVAKHQQRRRELGQLQQRLRLLEQQLQQLGKATGQQGKLLQKQLWQCLQQQPSLYLKALEQQLQQFGQEFGVHEKQLLEVLQEPTTELELNRQQHKQLWQWFIQLDLKPQQLNVQLRRLVQEVGAKELLPIQQTMLQILQLLKFQPPYVLLSPEDEEQRIHQQLQQQLHQGQSLSEEFELGLVNGIRHIQKLIKDPNIEKHVEHLSEQLMQAERRALKHLQESGNWLWLYKQQLKLLQQRRQLQLRPIRQLQQILEDLWHPLEQPGSQEQNLWSLLTLQHKDIRQMLCKLNEEPPSRDTLLSLHRNVDEALGILEQMGRQRGELTQRASEVFAQWHADLFAPQLPDQEQLQPIQPLERLIQRLKTVQKPNHLWRSNDEMLEEAKNKVLLITHEEETARKTRHEIMSVFDSLLEMQKCNQKLTGFYDREHDELHKQAVQFFKEFEAQEREATSDGLLGTIELHDQGASLDILMKKRWCRELTSIHEGALRVNGTSRRVAVKIFQQREHHQRELNAIMEMSKRGARATCSIMHSELGAQGCPRDCLSADQRCVEDASAANAAASADVIQLRGGSTVRMLHEPLGHGAPGRVSKGRLRIGATGRPVAVKAFRLEDKVAYDQELLAMKRWVGSPNIINLIVSGEDVVIGDPLIIVTKMFFGDLRSYFDDRRHPGGWGTLPFDDIDISLMQDVSSALQLMADEGFVHRDVKPSNILVDKREEHGKLHYHAVLGGLSQSVSVQVGTTEVLEVAGTPLYRAPETLDAIRPQYSEQSDKYSFGIVFYSTIGRKEIEISDFLTDPDSTDAGAVEAEVVLTKGLRPQIPSEVPGIIKSILQQCWKQSPAERGSFKQVRAELQVAYEAICELNGG